MSTGETPPSVTARFTSPSTTTKKYPGTPKSPMLNTNNITANAGGNRSSQARQRLIAGKISAPPPMNLPSLRREHAAGTEAPVASPASSHGWGSTSNSPSLTRTEIKSSSPPPAVSTEKHITSPKTSTHTKFHKETTTPLSPPSPPSPPPPKEPKVTAVVANPTSPVLVPSQASSTRAWAVPTVTETKAQPPSSTDFPTAAEAASTKKKPSLIDDKEYLKYASSDPNHTSWDEMVSEDLDDFSVDVVEFDDGTRVQVESDTTAATTTTTTTTEPVLPSDRFTDDYDRSYPPKLHHQHHHHHNDHPHNDHHSSTGGYKPYRRSEDHGYNARYNYDNRRSSGEGERRYSSSDRWSSNRENGYRRSSYDRKPDQIFHPTTLLQRPRRLSEQSLRSDHSQEHTNPLEIIPEPATEAITVAQKNLMLTAAERAKKRLDEQEAEYKAAAERARQKAAALAEKAKEAEKAGKAEIAEKDEKVEKAAIVEVEKKILTKKTPKDTPSRASTSTKPDSPKANTELAPKVPDTSKPWNLVAAKTTVDQKPTSPKKQPAEADTTKEEATSPTVTAESSTTKVPRVIAKDQQSWDNYVTKVRSDKPITAETVSSTDWNSFATRLQESEVELASAAKQKFKATEDDLQEAPKQQVEILDYAQNEEWGTIPAHLLNGRAPDRSGWIRNKDEYRSRSGSRSNGKGSRTKPSRSHGFTKSTDQWRSEEEEQPIVLEILKHEPKKTVEPESQPKEAIVEEVVSKKTRLANLLKESTSSIFPEYIEKLAGKKPANMSFMVDIDESDRDITMMGVIVETQESKSEVEAEKENSVSSAVVDETTSATSSTASTPPRSQFQQNGLAHQDKLDGSPRTRMSGNPNFPVLVYQYSVNQQTEDVGPVSNGYHSRPKGMQQQQRPMGVYLMPQQQYMTSNQYMVPYPQAGTSNVQPVYFPTLPWQQQQQQQQQPQPHYNSSTSPRPAYEQRRPFNQKFNSNGYQNHRYGNSYPQQQRGTFRKRGQTNSPWSGVGRGRGGFNNYHGKRYNNNDRDNGTTISPPTFEAEPSTVL